MFHKFFDTMVKVYASRMSEYEVDLPQPLPLPAELQYMIMKIYMTDLRRSMRQMNKWKLQQYLEFPLQCQMAYTSGVMEFYFASGCHRWSVAYDDDGYCIQNDHIFRYKNRKYSIRTFN